MQSICMTVYCRAAGIFRQIQYLKNFIFLVSISKPWVSVSVLDPSVPLSSSQVSTTSLHIYNKLVPYRTVVDSSIRVSQCCVTSELQSHVTQKLGKVLQIRVEQI